MPHRLNDATVALYRWISRAADTILNSIAPLSIPCASCVRMHHPSDDIRNPHD